jgi:hypothetical protein
LINGIEEMQYHIEKQMTRDKHPYFRDKETVRQAGSSAHCFSPARKISLFLGSLSSSRNLARSPPDGFLTSPPDSNKIHHGNEDAS